MNDEAYLRLDRLAIAAGTDKSSAHHNYTKIYSHFFDSIREKPIKFLEIGIFQGNSVKLWESYFPLADLHFIDINPQLIQYHSTRSHYHFLDQSNPQDLKNFIETAGKGFDVIIDDGGHLMNQQITSFLLLFPALKSGGIYVIEDLHTSYWSQFGGGGTFQDPKTSTGSTIEFLKRLIDDVNYVGARVGCANHDKIPLEVSAKLHVFQQQIFSMTFFDSLCFIVKK